MALVWQYGEVSGYESWKGLSWGMVSDYCYGLYALAFDLPFMPVNMFAILLVYNNIYK